MTAWYTVTALDADGYDVSKYESGSSKREAIRQARDSLKHDTELRAAGMVRVTVTDEAGTVHEASSVDRYRRW